MSQEFEYPVNHGNGAQNACNNCSAHDDEHWGPAINVVCKVARFKKRKTEVEPKMIDIPSNCPNGYVATATGIPRRND